MMLHKILSSVIFITLSFQLNASELTQYLSNLKTFQADFTQSVIHQVIRKSKKAQV